MVDEFQGQMIDASSETPFYGIFHGDNLVARMALLRKGDVEELYFPDYDNYILLWKLEVLPNISIMAMDVHSLTLLKRKVFQSKLLDAINQKISLLN